MRDAVENPYFRKAGEKQDKKEWLSPPLRGIKTKNTGLTRGGDPDYIALYLIIAAFTGRDGSVKIMSGQRVK